MRETKRLNISYLISVLERKEKTQERVKKEIKRCITLKTSLLLGRKLKKKKTLKKKKRNLQKKPNRSEKKDKMMKN